MPIDFYINIMIRILYILLFLIISNIGFSQIKEIVEIDNKKYEIIIDTITHKIKDINIIKEIKFYEKLYLGTDFQKDNLEHKILYDITDYSKISIGYDVGRKRFTLGAYINLGKLHRRNYNTETIYF